MRIITYAFLAVLAGGFSDAANAQSGPAPSNPGGMLGQIRQRPFDVTGPNRPTGTVVPHPTPYPFTYSCPMNTFLVGLTAKTAAWVGQIRGLCARLSEGHTVDVFAGTSIGDQFKGHDVSARCADGSGVKSVTYKLVANVGRFYVQSLFLACAPVSSPDTLDPGTPGQVFGGFWNPEAEQVRAPSSCPTGQIAEGVHGTTDGDVANSEYIASVELNCANAGKFNRHERSLHRLMGPEGG